MTFYSFLLLLLLAPTPAQADQAVDGCIAAWKNSPFKKGTAPDQVVGTQVKVFGIGKDDYSDAPTDKPRLILIKPSVNVLGKTSFHLLNPNGWYCFRANVSVLGKMNIDAVCGAKLASSKEDGTSVLGSDESDRGVTVLGSLRVNRLGDCGKKEEATPKIVTVTSTMTSTQTATH